MKTALVVGGLLFVVWLLAKDAKHDRARAERRRRRVADDLPTLSAPLGDIPDMPAEPAAPAPSPSSLGGPRCA